MDVDGCALRLHTLAPAGRLRDVLAPTVVLVHGIGMSHRSFHRTQRALAVAGHRTVSVDLPGFGGVPGPGRRQDVEELGDMVVRAVAAHGAGELVLVGQSMGTQVVAEAARLHPDAVSSVVLIGPVVAAGRRSAVLQGIDLARDCVREGVRMNGVVGTDYLRSMPQYLRELRPMLRHRLEDTLPRLGQPVLVVRGSEDPIARRDWAQRLAAVAGQGAFVELPGPHHVQEHQPVAFAGLVDEFRRVQTLGARG